MNKNWIAACLLIVTSFLVHGIAAKNPYYFDDIVTIRENPDLDSVKPPLQFYRSIFINSQSEFTGYRPTLLMSYWANIRLLGKSSTSVRTGNILLHTINAFLWVLLILQLTGAAKNSTTWLVAWLSGFAFLLHPIQTLAINFLWKRSTVLEVFFILLACILHVRERNRNSIYRWPVVILQMFLFFCAITTKESAIVLPFFLLLIDLCFYRTVFQKIPRQLLTIFVPLGLTAIGFYYFRIHIGSSWFGSNTVIDFQSNSRDLTSGQYFIESITMLPRYLSLWMVPKPLLFDDPLHFQRGWQLWLSGGLALFVFSFFFAYRFRKNPLIPFFIGMIWISFIPVTSLVSIRFVMDQIRLYFPIAGLSGLAILTLFSLQKRTRFQKVIPVTLILVLGSYAVLSLLQNIRYKNPIFIYQDVVREYPKSGMGWDNLAVAYHGRELFIPALQAHRAAAIVEPENPDFMVKDKMWKAFFTVDSAQRKKLFLAIDVSRANATTLLMLIQNEMLLKDYDVASVHLNEALKRFSAYAPVHVALGQVWEKTGNLEDARKAYANALLLSPDNSEALAGQNRIGKPPLR